MSTRTGTGIMSANVRQELLAGQARGVRGNLERSGTKSNLYLLTTIISINILVKAY